jgi:hypothetical protein
LSSKLYRNQLTQLQADKAKLEVSLATERTRLAKLQKEASKLREDAAKTKSETTRKSKTKQLLSKQDDIAKSQKKIGDIEQKIAKKLKAINQKMTQLAKAEESETKKRQRDELQHQDDINEEIDQQMQLENARKAVRLFSGREGEALRLSEEARTAAKQLLEMLEQGEIEKESRLISFSTFGGTQYQLSKPQGQLAEFHVPIADIKELAAYGVLSLQERRSKGRTSGWDMLLLPERLKEVVTGNILPDVFRVFYSWQSWTPGNINRHFILSALENAVKEIRDDETIEVEPVVDRDTLGEAGSVDIVATIFRKIENSVIFVCDATIITNPEAINHSPNPNVMVELGYAAAVLGWERIICVVNTAYGDVEQLPFDLRSRRMLSYNLPPDVENKADARKQLTKSLRDAISVIIEQISLNNRDIEVSDDI